MIDYQVAEVQKHHNRNDFDCGEPALNTYLQRYSTQNQSMGLSSTHIMELVGGGGIIGYFCLSASSLSRAELPEENTKRYPRYIESTGVILLGRLAVDNRYKGQGLGAQLLHEALIMCCRVLPVIGFTAVIVDAKHDKAMEFYRRYGFIQMPDNPLRLFMPKKQLEQIVRPLL